MKCNRSRVTLVTVTLALAVLAGCASQTMVLNLWYNPVTKPSSLAGTSVAIVRFVDAREDQGGGVRSAKANVENIKIRGLNLEIATQDLGGWVANALDKELSRAGCNVEKYSDAAPADAAVAITGSVTNLEVNPPRMGLITSDQDWHAKVGASIAVTKGGIVVLSRQYQGVRAYSNAWGENYKVQGEKCLQAALEEVMKKAIPDIAEVLR